MLNKQLEIFRNKKILITGNTGFKGSWLTIWLLKLGAKVIGYSKDIPTNPSLFEICNLNEKITHFNKDILDKIDFEKVISETKPDFIFHLAAQPLVRNSYKDPLSTIHSNAVGTLNLLEILKNYDGNTIVIFVTSDKVYENYEWIWGYKETDRIGGKDPYSASKAMAEIAIRSYFYSFLNKKDNLKIGIGRAGNVMGGGDWSQDRIVPDCMLKWVKNEEVIIRNPLSTRPWQHVLDPLSGYLTLAYELYNSKEQNGEAFNFGPINNLTFNVQELIETMISFWPNNIKSSVKIEKEKYPHEAVFLKLNCDNAGSLLNWTPNIEFKECVRMTINWYENYYFNNKPILKYTENQIDEFMETLKYKNQK